MPLHTIRAVQPALVEPACRWRFTNAPRRFSRCPSP